MYYFIYTSDENNKIYMYNDQRNKDNLCLICWSKNETNDELFYIKNFNHYIVNCECNILIHFTCMDKWIQQTQSCPICRKSIAYNYLYVKNQDDIFVKFKQYATATQYMLGVLKLATMISFFNFIWLILFNTYFQYLFLFEFIKNYLF
jgi:hypothetical protein